MGQREQQELWVQLAQSAPLVLMEQQALVFKGQLDRLDLLDLRDYKEMMALKVFKGQLAQ
jgi:hypothetical protein